MIVWGCGSHSYSHALRCSSGYVKLVKFVINVKNYNKLMIADVFENGEIMGGC